MYQNRFVIFVSSLRQKPPMNRHLTYRPQTAHIPADSLLGNPCDSRDPRRSMNPLTGIWPACATVPGYRYASPNGEGYPAAILHSTFFILHLSYTFSAKEKDVETGLSYFGSRYYSSDLSIWLSVDPMAAKYASLSPYVYCADNPVKLVDPNGEEISLEIIYKKDANGNDTKEIEKYNIRITGKILNSSGRHIDMEKAKEKIINQIETSFKGQTEDGIPVTTSADFEVANSYKEVKENDHLFVLTNDSGSDNGHSFKGYTPKNGGMVAFVNASLFKGPIDGTFGRSGAIAAAHEMGHMFGLHHVGNPFNLMRTRIFHNRLNSFVSSRQLGNIIHNIQFKSPLIKKVNRR